ncbi:MAG: type II secretion system F family protein [Pirellulaceae bacterium]|nr:type II secretion system F family protein [Pirellulaceae bacterium]
MDESLGAFNLTLLALPGLALKVAVWAMYGRRPALWADPMRVLLASAGTVLLVIAIVGGLAGMVGASSVYGIVVLVVLAVVTLMAIDRYRHGEHRSLVWSLAAAAQRGIPLPEAARAYADEALGDTGARALALARGLEAGLPLSQAVRQARLRTSTAMKLAIRLGEELGVLCPAMRQQIDDSAEVDAALRNAISRLVYLVSLVLAAIGVETFVMLKIVPYIERIYEDFGLALPSVTVWVINLSNFFVARGWVVAVPLLSVVTLAALVGGLLYFIGWFPRGWLLWLPFRRYDGALVMRGLALAVRRGLALPEALWLLAVNYPYGEIGLLLHNANLAVRRGGEWTEALRQAKLIGRADAAVLASAQRAGNLPWALEEMAESALRRQAYRLQAVVNLLFPVATLVLVAFGGLFAIGVMMPLIALIQGLS